MTKLSCHSAVCCIMALVLPLSTLSAETTMGAVMSPSGMVSIGGSLVKESATLSGGEDVSTGPKSVAQFVLPGTNALLASESVISFTQDFFKLSSGAILVTTTKLMPVHVGDKSFGPATPLGVKNVYEVRKDKCRLTVIAREGSVTLPDGKLLEQGKSFTHAEDGCAYAELADRGSHKILIWGLLGSGVGAGIGLGLLGTGGSNPVSPHRP